MNFKLILSVLICIFSCQSSHSQNYIITKTLEGNDSVAFALLRTARNDYGFGVVNSKGEMAWQIDVPGTPLGMGKFKNNVVLFYTNDKIDGLGSIKEIHAAMMGISEKKILFDKIVYTNPNKNIIEPIVLDDPANNFDYLLIRISPQKGGFGSIGYKAQNRGQESAQLSIISLDSSLATRTKDLKDIALETFFVGACMGDNNDVYISSFSKDQLITEKFDEDGNLKGKLTVEASIIGKSKMDPIIQIFPIIKYDATQKNCVDLAMRYRNDHKDDIIRLFRFNFNGQKAYSTEETVLDKSYVKHFQKDGDKKNKLSNFESIDHMNPVQILETNDKVILLNEIQHETGTGSSSDPQKFYREGNVISFYTKDLHPITEVIIDKYMGSYILGGTSIYSAIKTDELYTITCQLERQLTYKTILWIINPDNDGIEKRTLEKGDAGKASLTDPTTVLWFNKHFIVPYSSSKAFTRLKFETDLQSENY
jgi:hypothetical protein